MATYEELMNAARRADAAGDWAGARRFLELAAPMRSTQSPMPVEDVRRLAGAAIDRSEAMTTTQATTAQSPQASPMTIEQQRALALAAARRRRAEADAAPPTAPGTVGGMAGAATDGALFGFGDEYLAGLSAVMGLQPDGQGGANWFQYDRPIGDRYGVALDAIRREQGQFSEDRPAAALGAEIGGSLLAPGVSAAGRFINAGATGIGRIARTAAVGGATGAAYGFGEGEGSATERAASALPAAAVGVVAGGALGAVGEGFARGARALSRDPATRADAPTLEGLRATANDLYARAEALGGTMPEPTTRQMVQGITGKLQAEGFDRQLHPRLATVLERLTSTTGPQSLGELSILRRVAGNAAQSLQPDERRLASILIDEMDDAVSAIGGGSGVLAEARDVWARMRRLEAVEQAIDKAATTDNFAASLRAQFRALLNNPRRIRGFSDAERAAIREVATGSGGVRALRALGRILSPTEMSGAALGGGALYASLSGAGVLPLALPAMGYGMKRAADGMTSGAAQRARAAVAGILPVPVRNPVAVAPFAAGILGGAFPNEGAQ